MLCQQTLTIKMHSNRKTIVCVCVKGTRDNMSELEVSEIQPSPRQMCIGCLQVPHCQTRLLLFFHFSVSSLSLLLSLLSKPFLSIYFLITWQVYHVYRISNLYTVNCPCYGSPYEPYFGKSVIYPVNYPHHGSPYEPYLEKQ